MQKHFPFIKQLFEITKNGTFTIIDKSQSVMS